MSLYDLLRIKSKGDYIVDEYVRIPGYLRTDERRIKCSVYLYVFGILFSLWPL